MIWQDVAPRRPRARKKKRESCIAFDLVLLGFSSASE